MNDDDIIDNLPDDGQADSIPMLETTFDLTASKSSIIKVRV